MRKTSVDIMRRMSAKARRYMLTYRLFDEYGDDANFENEGLSYAEIEKYVSKLMKCHQSSADQDTGFISRIWREAPNLEQHDGWLYNSIGHDTAFICIHKKTNKR